MSDLPETTDLPAIDLGPYRITPQFEKWRQLYLDDKNKETFGNSTESVIQSYNLDRQTQYGSARVIGSENLTKLNNLRITVQEYLTSNGFTLPVLINHALKMMSDPKVKTTHWWKELMMMAGYIESKAGVTIQNNTQINNNNIQIDPEEARRLRQDFASFINAKYRGLPAMNPDTVGGQSG